MFIVALMFISPYALIVAIVMLAVLVPAHPTAALSVAATLMLVVAIGIVQRLRGHLF